MEVFYGSWSEFFDFHDSAVTVGSFDGVHLGHQRIFQQLIESAEAQRLRSVIVTFEPHPRLVVSDKRQPIRLLTPTEEKIELLRNLPIDLLCILRFDKTASELSHQDFTQIVLKGRIGLKRIVIGYNHAFGKNRGGDRESLIALSRELEFQVDVLNPVEVDGLIVSSTKVRSLLTEGDVARAAVLLGRRYLVRGKVVKGQSRGKKMKFPTANLAIADSVKLVPGDGVYCGVVRARDERFPAAISVGKNLTFSATERSTEVHLIDFKGDIYDETLEVEFVQKLRGMQKFANEKELAKQISKDVRRCLAILEEQNILKRV